MLPRSATEVKAEKKGGMRRPSVEPVR